jgi:hypothetical protein
MFATLFTTCLLVAVGGVAYYIGKFVGATEEVRKQQLARASGKTLPVPIKKSPRTPPSPEYLTKTDWGKVEEW